MFDPENERERFVLKGTGSISSRGKITTGYLCITAVSTALVCVATMVVQIPIPLGYAHLGDSFIWLAAYLFDWKAGMFAGGVGSALADLLSGYPQWVLPTLIIKAVQGFLAAGLVRGKKGERKLFSVRTLAGIVLSMSEMVMGYVIGGAILAGSFASGLASAPGLLLKGILNCIVFYAAAAALKKAGAIKETEV